MDLTVQKENDRDYLAFGYERYFLVPKNLVQPYTKWQQLQNYLEEYKSINLMFLTIILGLLIVLSIVNTQFETIFFIVCLVFCVSSWIYFLKETLL